MTPELPPEARDPLMAAIDLVNRAGARSVEFGYLHDDVPVAEADWWATAEWQGTKITSEHHRGPIAAMEALARRLLDGGLCTHCGHRVTLSYGGKSTTVPATRRATPRQRCRWWRDGARWVRGCADTVPEGHRVIEHHQRGVLPKEAYQ